MRVSNAPARWAGLDEITPTSDVRSLQKWIFHAASPSVRAATVS